MPPILEWIIDLAGQVLHIADDASHQTTDCACDRHYSEQATGRLLRIFVAAKENWCIAEDQHRGSQRADDGFP